MHRTTDRLILRPPEPADLAALFAIYGDPATNTFNPAGPMANIELAASLLDRWLAQWRELGIGPWTIATLDAPGHPIGFGGISMHRYLDHERVNVGYRFATSAWGRGYATELTRASLAFGFEEQGFSEIFALVRPAHAASIRVLEKAGMQQIDTLDDVPGAAPSRVYAISREAWAHV
ncbi:GNAT family N-acetyltransferase [uncultured Massilia sp.]|uniref:GNAT family N-acetyltransferase n=1 Tax=uncultured Massilia sp. TaxID=169973 RepID=UPI00258E97DB|nr:GNAT family N-acetyltransferase [uncultured Massilia sp.]